MRRLRIALVVVAGAIFSCPTQAQSPGPYLRVIAEHLPFVTFDVLDYTIQCPAGHLPVGYSYARRYSYDEDLLHSLNLIDTKGATVNRDALTSAAPLAGGGFAVSIENTEHHEKEFEVMAVCLSLAASTDGNMALVQATASAAPGSVGSVRSFCNADYPVALGGFSNADFVLLQDAGSGPVWGTSASPILLADVPDGQTGPPTGWQSKIYNLHTSAATIISYSICGRALNLQTFIYSTPTVPRSLFNIFGAVPDGWAAIGTGFDGGLYGLYSVSDAWLADGTVVNQMQWFTNTRGYDSGAVAMRAFMVKGADSRLKAGVYPDATARAVLAVLAVPQPATVPPPTIVGVVEFYNAALDHYFISPIADEIAKLDNGTFKGWTRTGQIFNAYGVGSTGRAGRRPVCREYGLPSQGLNSHFYSASPDECFAVMSNLSAWGLETSELFEMDLPDATTGACPPGDIPVYRIWNQRLDSNHRYTTSTAIRDQMVAKGGVAEGYGNDAVALCALP